MLPVSRHHLADTAHPVTGPALQPSLNDTPFVDERVIEQHIEAGIPLCDAVNFLVENTRWCVPTSRDSAPVPALS